MGLSRISKDCKIIELALEYNMSERKTWSADVTLDQSRKINCYASCWRRTKVSRVRS